MIKITNKTANKLITKRDPYRAVVQTKIISTAATRPKKINKPEFCNNYR